MDQTNLHFLYLKYWEANTIVGLQCVQSTAQVYLDFCAEWTLKGHCQLWDCADLDTSFFILKKVHLNLKSKYI